MSKLKKVVDLGRTEFKVMAVIPVNSRFQENKVGYIGSVLVILYAYAAMNLQALREALVKLLPLEEAFNSLVDSGIELTVDGQDLSVVGNTNATSNRSEWIPPAHLTDEQVELCRAHYEARIARNSQLIRANVHNFEDQPSAFVPAVGQKIEAEIVERSVPGTNRVIWVATDMARCEKDSRIAIEEDEAAIVRGYLGGTSATTQRDADVEEELSDEEIEASELEEMVATS